MEKQFLELAEDYEREIREALNVFMTRAGLHSLEEVRKFRFAPSRADGYLPGRPRIVYRYHGYGLYLRIGRQRIDFDFGPGMRIGRFDSWKLWIYATERKDRYPEFQDQEVIESALALSIAAGRVGRPFGHEREWLYYRL